MANMVDLRREKKDDDDFPSMLSSDPTIDDYGHELCLCLTDATCEKMGLDTNVERGDVLHLRGMVQVTAVHKGMDGTRIECVLTHAMPLEIEDENTEGDDE